MYDPNLQKCFYGFGLPFCFVLLKLQLSKKRETGTSHLKRSRYIIITLFEVLTSSASPLSNNKSDQDMADTNALHCGDMLSFFNSLVCTTVKEIEGVNQSSISLSSLKLNKKRASGDLILPGFVRACCVSDQQSSRENVSLSLKY